MSVFGGAVSNFQAAGARDGGSKSNGYSDERRNGRKKQFRPKTQSGGNSNGNVSTNKSSNSNGNASGQSKRVWRKQESRSQSPYIQDGPTRVAPKSTGKFKTYTPEQIQLTGPIVLDPTALGFTRGKTVPNRPIPKYLLGQPRLLVTPPFKQDPWDKKNQQTMDEMERANQGKDYQGLYEEFQKMREVERKQMEALGLVDAENISKDLTEAISFQGSCTDMCPVFERVRRQLENNVKALEKDPVTNKISRDLAVKAFSRPAAGQPPPLPSEVRPPHILKQTLDYLVENVVDKLPDAHSFIWDRTRSIRQDFTYQNSFGPEAIDCNERIVRIHLLSLHIMAGADVEYSQQQELEQFNKALQTLIEIYQDVRNHGGKCANEAEFRAYHLLSHYRDPELEREIQTLPNYIFHDPQVQLALKLRNIISQNNIVERGYINSIGALNMFVEFFRIVYSDETPFLMACLLETHFNEIRFYSLKAMARSYHTRGKAYSAEALKNILGYDSLDKLIKFVEYYEIDVVHENSEVLVDLFNKEKLEKNYKLNSIQDKPKLSQTYSSQLDMKIKGKSLKDFINQGFPNTDLHLSTNQKPISTISEKPPSISNPPTIGFGANTMPTANFKKPPASLNNNNLLNGPPSTTLVKEATSTFKTNDAQSSSSKNDSSNNLFGRTDITKPVSNNVPFSAPEKPPKVSFNLSFGAPTKNDNFKPPQVLQTEKPVNNTFTLPSIKTESVEAPKPEIKFPSIPTTVAPKPKPVPKAVVTESKKLSSSIHYKQAVTEIATQILANTVSDELSNFLPRLIEKYGSIREHEEIIKTFRNELYRAFISEVIYNATLEAQADFIYSRNLKLHWIRRLLKVGQSLQQQNELKKRKIDELQSITFKKNGLKRFASNSDLSFSKRRNTSNSSTTEIISKHSDIEELWAPLDLSRFLSVCSHNIKVNIEAKNVELSFLLVVENWSSMYSKWLNSKLGLKANNTTMNYERLESNEKLSLKLTSLPSNNYLNKDFFSSTSFILFECGLMKKDEVSIQEKLNRDKGILSKIISLVDKFSYYKVQILLVYWDVSESGLSIDEVRSSLNYDIHIKNSNTIQDIVVCDMTSTDSNINDILVDGFDTLSKNFRGDLTNKGKRKKDRVARINHPKPTEVPKVVESSFKQKEDSLLQKAKKLKRYDYLTQHILNKPGSNAFNTSIGSRTTIQPNASLYNSSFVSNLTMQRRNNDSTFLNLNTTGYNTTLNNMSILTGFGNGMIEESTPVGSPKRQRTDGSKSTKLQSLRQLTAEITAKYKNKA